MKKKHQQTVIIVTAYGDDNYFQKRYEDIVGIYTSVKNAINGAKADGLTSRQMDYLNRINAFYLLDKALVNNEKQTFQVEYERETDKRRRHCVSSYQFATYTLD